LDEFYFAIFSYFYYAILEVSSYLTLVYDFLIVITLSYEGYFS